MLYLGVNNASNCLHRLCEILHKERKCYIRSSIASNIILNSTKLRNFSDDFAKEQKMQNKFSLKLTHHQTQITLNHFRSRQVLKVIIIIVMIVIIIIIIIIIKQGSLLS